MRRAFPMLLVATALGCAPLPDTATTTVGEDDAPAPRIGGRVGGDCSDRADNDADGAFDCDDDGCNGSPDCVVDTSAGDPDIDDTGQSVDSGTGDTDTGVSPDTGSEGSDTSIPIACASATGVLIQYAIQDAACGPTASSSRLRLYDIYDTEKVLDETLVTTSDAPWVSHIFNHDSVPAMGRWDNGAYMIDVATACETGYMSTPPADRSLPTFLVAGAEGRRQRVEGGVWEPDLNFSTSELEVAFRQGTSASYAEHVLEVIGLMDIVQVSDSPVIFYGTATRECAMDVAIALQADVRVTFALPVRY